MKKLILLSFVAACAGCTHGVTHNELLGSPARSREIVYYWDSTAKISKRNLAKETTAWQPYTSPSIKVGPKGTIWSGEIAIKLTQDQNQPCAKKEWAQEKAGLVNKDVSGICSNSVTLNREDRLLNILIQNPQLQSFETEQVGLTVHHDDTDNNLVVVDAESGPTIYKAERSQKGKTINVVLTGVGRRLVNLPDVSVGNEATRTEDGVAFTVSVNKNYIPNSQQDADDKLVLKYTVLTCAPAAKISKEAKCGNDWRQGPEKIQPVSERNVVINVPMKKGEKAKLSYRFVRLNSKWYNSLPTRAIETDQAQY